MVVILRMGLGRVVASFHWVRLHQALNDSSKELPRRLADSFIGVQKTEFERMLDHFLRLIVFDSPNENRANQ